MSQRTAIGWTDVTWNPVRGCSRVSTGCARCYAERIAARFSKSKEYAGDTFTLPYHGFATAKGWTGKVAVIPDVLLAPIHWKKPRRVFVNSMSDLFHEALEDDDIDRVFGIMDACPQHTFQILTKRPKRMLEYCGRIKPCRSEGERWPLPNVWLGVSVENQATADERIPLLLRTPAALRFVSYEPALGPVSFRWLPAFSMNSRGPCSNPDAESTNELDGLRRIDWLIIGGESGPGARSMNLEWVRSAVAQCREAGVPVFVKQDSGPRPGKQGRIPDDLWIKEFPK